MLGLLDTATSPQAPFARASSGSGLSRCVSRISLLAPDAIMSSGWLEHGAFAFWLIETLAPRKFVELGSHFGYSYFVVCQAVRKLNLPTACYAVDTWAGDEHAGFYDDAVYDSVVALNEKYKGFSTLMRTTFEDAVKYFPDGSVDLLHIDGRHFYDDVKTDFEIWRPKLTDDAVVLFHDTNVRERDFGVWRLFDELKKDHATFEFVHGNGLGVMAMGKSPEPLRELFECSEQEADDVRSTYAQLGASLSKRWAAKDHQNEAERLAAELKKLLETHRALCASHGDLQQRHYDLVDEQRKLLDKHRALQRNHDDVAESAAAAQRALQSLATSETLRATRAIGRLPLAGSAARLSERVRPSTNDQVQAAEAEIIARIQATGLFQSHYYVTRTPEIVLSGVDPALHFAQTGWKEGRRPNPFFDPLFYLSEYPDVAQAGTNPLLHYADGGWREGRKPSREFDTTHYLERYPDVAATGVNPLLHYLDSGRREGREAVRGNEALPHGLA